MEKYLGVKLIEAELMWPEAAEDHLDRPISASSDKDGYLVKYEDGYESWSPKDVFEKAYRKIKTVEHLIENGIKVKVGFWEERVLSEAEDLNLKIHKLNEFIELNNTFPTLPEEEQNRLQQQLLAMQYYLTILVERIENFK